jgi:hypothetical protein
MTSTANALASDNYPGIVGSVKGSSTGCLLIKRQPPGQDLVRRSTHVQDGKDLLPVARSVE